MENEKVDEKVRRLASRVEELELTLKTLRDLNPAELSRRLHIKHLEMNRPLPTADEGIVDTLAFVETLAERVLAGAHAEEKE